MPTDITNQLQVLEKPLKFASGNSFKNLNKVKNLEKVIGEITLKIVSEISDDDLKKKLSTIKDSFKSFDKKTSEDKISIINRALESIAKLNTKVSVSK